MGNQLPSTDKSEQLTIVRQHPTLGTIEQCIFNGLRCYRKLLQTTCQNHQQRFRLIKQRSTLFRQKGKHPAVGFLDVKQSIQQELCASNYSLHALIEHFTTLREVEKTAQERRKYLSEDDLLHILRGVVASISWLYDNGSRNAFPNRDNMLLTQNGAWKIMDGELSIKLHPFYALVERADLCKGDYVAPELLRDALYFNKVFPNMTIKADIFALGLVLLELASKKPLDYLYDYSTFEFNCKGLKPALKGIENTYPNIASILTQMTSVDPQERIGIATLTDKVTYQSMQLEALLKDSHFQKKSLTQQTRQFSQFDSFTVDSEHNKGKVPRYIKVSSQSRSEHSFQGVRIVTSKAQGAPRQNASFHEGSHHQQNKKRQGQFLGEKILSHSSQLVIQQKSFKASPSTKSANNRSVLEVKSSAEQIGHSLENKHNQRLSRISTPLPQRVSLRKQDGKATQNYYLKLKVKPKQSLFHPFRAQNKSIQRLIVSQNAKQGFWPSSMEMIGNQYTPNWSQNILISRQPREGTLRAAPVYSALQPYQSPLTPVQNCAQLTNNTNSVIHTLQKLNTFQELQSPIRQLQSQLTEKTLPYRFEVHRFPNGARYEGFMNDKNEFHGKGTLYCADGSKCFEGSWQCNHFHGLGTLFNIKQEETYQAYTNYHNFESNTSGHWVRYEGQFVEDRKEGYGVLSLRNGDIFSGQFFGDMIEGFGRFISTKGSNVVQGEWKNNQLVKITSIQ